MSKHSRTTKKTSNPRLPLPRSPGEHPPRCLPPCLPRRARSPKTWSYKTSNAHASMPAHQRQLRLIRQPTQTTARAAKAKDGVSLGRSARHRPNVAESHVSSQTRKHICKYRQRHDAAHTRPGHSRRAAPRTAIATSSAAALCASPALRRDSSNRFQLDPFLVSLLP